MDLQVFDTLCSKCGTPLKLRDNTSSGLTPPLRSSLESMSAAEFADIIAYLSDVAHTLHSFLRIYPASCSAFWDSGFPVRLAAAYECFAVVIATALGRRAQRTHSVAAVKTQFRRAQVCLLRTFRLIVYHVSLRPVAERTASDGEVRPQRELINSDGSVMSFVTLEQDCREAQQNKIKFLT